MLNSAGCDQWNTSAALYPDTPVCGACRALHHPQGQEVNGERERGEHEQRRHGRSHPATRPLRATTIIVQTASGSITTFVYRQATAMERAKINALPRHLTMRRSPRRGGHSFRRGENGRAARHQWQPLPTRTLTLKIHDSPQRHRGHREISRIDECRLRTL